MAEPMSGRTTCGSGRCVTRRMPVLNCPRSSEIGDTPAKMTFRWGVSYLRLSLPVLEMFPQQRGKQRYGEMGPKYRHALSQIEIIPVRKSNVETEDTDLTSVRQRGWFKGIVASMFAR
jgi:hypothetical protein